MACISWLINPKTIYLESYLITGYALEFIYSHSNYFKQEYI